MKREDFFANFFFVFFYIRHLHNRTTYGEVENFLSSPRAATGKNLSRSLSGGEEAHDDDVGKIFAVDAFFSRSKKIQKLSIDGQAMKFLNFSKLLAFARALHCNNRPFLNPKKIIYFIFRPALRNVLAFITHTHASLINL